MYKTEVTCMTNVSSSTADKPVTDYDSESASAHKPDYESASIGNVSDKAGYHTKKDVDKPDYVPYPSKTKIHMDIHSNFQQQHFKTTKDVASDSVVFCEVVISTNVAIVVVGGDSVVNNELCLIHLKPKSIWIKSIWIFTVTARCILPWPEKPRLFCCLICMIM